MDTLANGIEAMEQTVELLQTILSEATLEYFTAPYTQTTERAGQRMLEIGQLLYSNPQDALHISLWESLAAIDPKIKNDEVYTHSLFRAASWDLAEMVTSETTWHELETAVAAKIPQRAIPSGDHRIVLIH